MSCAAGHLFEGLAQIRLGAVEAEFEATGWGLGDRKGQGLDDSEGLLNFVGLHLFEIFLLEFFSTRPGLGGVEGDFKREGFGALAEGFAQGILQTLGDGRTRQIHFHRWQQGLKEALDELWIPPKQIEPLTKDPPMVRPGDEYGVKGPKKIGAGADLSDLDRLDRLDNFIGSKRETGRP